MPRWRAWAAAFAVTILASSGAYAGQGHSHGTQGKAHAGHDHGAAHGVLRQVPAGHPVPGLSVEAIADPADGFNLHLMVQNFTFSPEHTGNSTDKVEGHAHLYVNGTKIGRIYGAWIHLPDKLLSPGENHVRISLYDNTHGAWAGAEGRPVEVALQLQGLRDLEVSLDGETVPEIAIGHGERVRLTIHGATAGELHFHGYDAVVEAVDGQPVRLDIHADKKGRFPVMTHTHDQLLGDQEKALLYIDIRSR